MGKTLNCLIIVLAVVLPAAAAKAGFVVDRVAAVVNGEVITKSELESAAKAEARRKGVSDAEGLARLRREAMETLIDRKLILSDARKFSIVEVSAEEVDHALASVKAGFGSEDEFERALKEEDMTLEDLRENLSEQLLVRKYVDRRIRFFVRVTLEDQKKYYAEHIDQFTGSFTDVSDQIHELLMEQFTARKLEEYIAELRSRADISINESAE